MAEPVHAPTRRLAAGTQTAHVAAPHTHRAERPARERHVGHRRLHTLQQLLDPTPTLHRTTRTQTAGAVPRRVHRHEPPRRGIHLTVQIPVIISPALHLPRQAETAPIAQPTADRLEYTFGARLEHTFGAGPRHERPPALRLPSRTQGAGLTDLRRRQEPRQCAGRVDRLGQLLGIRRDRRSLGQIALVGPAFRRPPAGLATTARGSGKNHRDDPRHQSGLPSGH